MMKSISCFSLVAALFFLYKLSRTFLSPLCATLPIYLLSHYIGIVWWTVSGLETALFIALVLLVTWQAVLAMGYKTLISQHHRAGTRHYHGPAWIVSCLSLTLLALTRFDGILWALFILLFVGCELKNNPNLDGYWKNIARIFTCCFIMPYAIYFIWRLYYFQHFLPNSYSCKFITPGHLLDLVKEYAQLALPCALLGLPYFFARKDCRHLLLWAPSVVYAVFLLRADPMVAHHNRLFLGAFSLLSLIPILGAHEFFSYFRFQEKNNALACTLTILIFTSFFIPAYSLSMIDLATKHYQERQYLRLKIAREINEHAEKNGRILLADCGVIPFFARQDIQFIDSLCLNNLEMGQIHTASALQNYAIHIKETQHPTWVITSYYPRSRHSNALDEALKNIHFFDDYTLVQRYQSHAFLTNNARQEDFVYLIYKRIS